MLTNKVFWLAIDVIVAVLVVYVLYFVLIVGLGLPAIVWFIGGPIVCLAIIIILRSMTAHLVTH
ncbi:MAG: hypothetical protein ACXVIB_05710 [Halobacteriota archaeon]